MERYEPLEAHAVLAAVDLEDPPAYPPVEGEELKEDSLAVYLDVATDDNFTDDATDDADAKDPEPDDEERHHAADPPSCDVEVVVEAHPLIERDDVPIDDIVVLYLQDALHIRPHQQRVQQDRQQFFSPLRTYRLHKSWRWSRFVFACIWAQMALAFAETPEVGGIPSWVLAVHMLCLIVIFGDWALKLHCYDPQESEQARAAHIFRVSKFILPVMFLHTLTILLVAACPNDESVLAIYCLTRALRPAYLFWKSRTLGKLTRAIIRALPIAVFLLIFVWLLLFAVLGYTLFWDAGGVIGQNEHFSTPLLALYTVFIQMTTANHPDALLSSYAVSKAVSIGCLVFVVGSMFLQSLVLAVVFQQYETFVEETVEVVADIRRKAVDAAFELLTRGEPDARVDKDTWWTLLRRLRPDLQDDVIDLFFDELDRDDAPGGLSQDQFHGICNHRGLSCLEMVEELDVDVILNGELDASQTDLELRLAELAPEHWALRVSVRLQRAAVIARKRLLSFWTWEADEAFKWGVKLSTDLAVNVLIAISTMLVIVDLYLPHQMDAVSAVIVGVFILEVALKMAAWGPRHYLAGGMNRLDFFVSMAAIIGEAAAPAAVDADIIVMLRILRVLRVLRAGRCFREILHTLCGVLPFFVALFILEVCVAYVFAIVGMQLFHDRLTEEVSAQHCLLEQAAQTDPMAVAPWCALHDGQYYLVNFNTFADAMNVQMLLLIINNWHVPTRMFAELAGVGVIAYFVLAVICVVVITSMWVSFVMDSYFRLSQGCIDSEKIGEPERKFTKKLSKAVLYFQLFGTACNRLEEREREGE